MSTTMRLGRCRATDYSGRKARGCGQVWTWPAGGQRTLGKMSCPWCQNLLSRTTHLVQRAPRPIPAATADLIAAGIFDDYGTSAWKR